MLLSKFGRKFFDEAQEGEGASSGTALAEPPKTAGKSGGTVNGAEARSPFGASTGMSDDEFQQKLAAAINTKKAESGNANVDIETGEVTKAPAPKKTPKAVKAEAPEETPETSKSKISDSIRSQLLGAYSIDEDELDDFESDEDAIRFMDRIDRFQARRLKQGREKEKAASKVPEESQEEDPESPKKPETRTVKDPVSAAQREIDRALGVESKSTTREVTPEEYVSDLRTKTVGVFESGNYEPEVVGAMTNLLDHIVFQDGHIRQMTQVLNRLMHQSQLIDQAAQRKDAENFLSLLDQHIGDVEKFGRDGARTKEQWENLQLVYEFANDIRNRRGDKSLSQAVVLRAASMAFEGKLRTRGQRMKDQSRLRMGSSTARTGSVAPTNPGQYRSDPAKNPIIAQKIAELKSELGK